MKQQEFYFHDGHVYFSQIHSDMRLPHRSVRMQIVGSFFMYCSFLMTKLTVGQFILNCPVLVLIHSQSYHHCISGWSVSLMVGCLHGCHGVIERLCDPDLTMCIKSVKEAHCAVSGVVGVCMLRMRKCLKRTEWFVGQCQSGGRQRRPLCVLLSLCLWVCSRLFCTACGDMTPTTIHSTPCC